MKEWQISLPELEECIKRTDPYFTHELRQFWDQIRIPPVKWRELEYKPTEGRFWVVARYRNLVIWYNDIEEGFNVSPFIAEGLISEYGCEQDEINIAVKKLYSIVAVK